MELDRSRWKWIDPIGFGSIHGLIARQWNGPIHYRSIIDLSIGRKLIHYQPIIDTLSAHYWYIRTKVLINVAPLLIHYASRTVGDNRSIIDPLSIH